MLAKMPPVRLSPATPYMNRHFWLTLALGVFAGLFAGLPSQAAPLTDDETLKLSTGETIKVLSVSKIEYSKGVMALMVRYQTTLSVDQRKALSDEVDDLWKVAVKDVERCNCSEAIISCNETPKGVFLTATRLLNFIYEKGQDGKWTRLGRADFLAAQ